MDVIVYHNPDCGTSRNTLGLIRNSGVEPHIIEYLKTPPSRALLAQLIERASLTARSILREKGTPYADLGLGDPELSDDALLDAMMAHPILINRPLVVTPQGVKLADRPKPFLICCPHNGASSSKRMASGSLTNMDGALLPPDFQPAIGEY